MILENGLDTQERADLFAVFVQTYPQSQLAEVALARALDSGADIRDVLEPLEEPARRALLRSQRSHQARLRLVAPSGPAVTDAE